jgi:N-acetylglutamate synthase-like GNAT family acetyltransferase
VLTKDLPSQLINLHKTPAIRRVFLEVTEKKWLKKFGFKIIF